jgi:hypothetical protein
MARRRNVQQSESAKLELLFDLYGKGVSIGDKNIQKLKAAGYIDEDNGDLVAESDDGKKVKLSVGKLTGDNLVSEKSIIADRHISIIYTDKKQKDSFLTPALFEKRIAWESVFSGSEIITSESWKPKSKIAHTEEFINWINSINTEDGFFTSIDYKPFNAYCKQAQMWIDDPTPDSMSEEQILEWRIRENNRCAENSLYALDKYGEIKEENAEGMKYYKAAKGHKVILYLLDCGYSLDITKARQVAFTTTICLWALCRAAFHRNVGIKYISEDLGKAKVTAEDKIKYPYGQMPQWLKPVVKNDNILQFFFGKKDKKGDTSGNNSSIDVMGPGKTKIASTTPTVTLIDETGNISDLNDLLSDLLPTMYGFNIRTQQQELMRQIVMWGTGGYMDKAGVALHAIFMSHWEAWKERRFDSGIIPLFMNTWWRPGMTKERYSQLKQEAYATEGPKAAELRIRFHQSFPITLEDVFLTGGNTLAPLEFIQSNLDRITSGGEKVSCDYGYFEPIYDTDSPAHEGSDVPFKIKGANFVPVRFGDERATTIIFLHPKKWSNRYFQGTDPIASDNGHSKMASAIWDSYFAMPVAVMNYRSNNYRYAYLQTVLLGLYYNTDPSQEAAPELVEANIGAAYREYKENKGLERSLVLGSELPMTLQTKTGSVHVGVDNKGLRNKIIIDYMKQIFDSFGDRIWMPIFFNQLKTFVCKIIGRSEVWEPQDKRYNWDDALFALTYSYICASCYSHRITQSLDGSSNERKEKSNMTGFKLVRDESGALRRMPLRIK